MNTPFIIILLISVVAIITIIVILSKRKEGYQPQNNLYSFMYTKDNNELSYRYNGEVPRFTYSNFYG